MGFFVGHKLPFFQLLTTVDLRCNCKLFSVPHGPIQAYLYQIIEKMTLYNLIVSTQGASQSINIKVHLSRTTDTTHINRAIKLLLYWAAHMKDECSKSHRATMLFILTAKQLHRAFNIY